ncbi:unnamed protein product [Adineta steineri]|uniref:LamG-like jellyroll fold domain-containing protein n=1 Tax=Adineta steineri TaxID=433720 RepID=A0A814LDS6_9BILA|nr:unnamed protein product [Adineta steineri]CAF4013096.1 unnamed protein product [Adineta steineri]
MSLWVQRTSTDGGTLIHYSTQTDGQGWCIVPLGFSSVGNIIATAWAPDNQVTGPILSINNWTHIATTYSQTSGLTLYVNGVSVGSTGAQSSNASSAVVILTLGNSLNGTGCSSQSIVPGTFSGYIDEFRVYSRELSAAEVSVFTKDKTCFDAIMDGDETDIDCGGSCLACAAYQMCKVDLDCTTGTSLISLDSIDGVVHGIYNTKINQNSQAAEVYSKSGQYHLKESPAQACDGDIYTKYLNYGECENTRDGIECGSNTGFYLELKRGASLVTGLQICTANDFPERDPLTMSLEGSNQSESKLTLGSSWALIYNGDSGLKTNPGRHTCGIVQQFNNTIRLDNKLNSLANIRVTFKLILNCSNDNNDNNPWQKGQLFRQSTEQVSKDPFYKLLKSGIAFIRLIIIDFHLYF